MNLASQRYSRRSRPRALRPPVRSPLQPVRCVPARLWILASLTILASLPGLALSACTFSPSELSQGPGSGVDASGPVDSARPEVDATVPDATPAPDAPLPPPSDVVHVPEEGWSGGPTPVAWNDDVTIDTTELTLTGPGVAGGTEGIVLDVQEHEPPGSQIAVLHLGSLTVASGVTVRVVGDLPLVVLSSGSIRLEGVIDAGARRQSAGAGGAAPGQGRGAGMPGSHGGDSLDSGGGGAGHATAGARGSDGCISSGGGSSDCSGSDTPSGGLAGVVYGDDEVTTLTGGAGGGTGGEGGSDPCTPGPGGAGGGAVQLYAAGTISIASSGGVLAGGGGGTGGEGAQCAAAAGGGGGAGGVIYIQAARIDLAGTLAANGGGGGAGAEVGESGRDGSDGSLDATPASGAVDRGDSSSAGGAGGAAATAPAQGPDDDENGGGGGGAVGYIVLHCSDFSGDGVISPAPHRTAGCAP
jgi:hypothetical protein